MNLMLLYVGLAVVSITINLCAGSLIRQLKKTGKYLKILKFFGELGNLSMEEDAASSADRDDRAAAIKRKGSREDKFEMENIQPECNNKRKENQEVSPLDDEMSDSATKLNIVRESTGKYYGSLHE